MSSLEVTVSESKADLIQTNDILKVKVVHNENELKNIQPRLPTYAKKASVSCGSSVKPQPTEWLAQIVYGLLAGMLVLIIRASMEKIYSQDFQLFNHS